METNPSRSSLQKSFNKFVRTVLKARIDKIELERELKKLESNYPMRSTKYELVSVSGTSGKKEPMYDWIIRIDSVKIRIEKCNNVELVFDLFKETLTEREQDLISLIAFQNVIGQELLSTMNLSRHRIIQLKISLYSKLNKFMV